MHIWFFFRYSIFILRFNFINKLCAYKNYFRSNTPDKINTKHTTYDALEPKKKTLNKHSQ